MRKNRRELATECNLEEVDNNMTNGVKPRGKIKLFDLFPTNEVCCGNARFIYEGEVVMIGHDGKELTFDMS